MSLSDKRKELRWQIEKRKEREAMSLLLDAVEKQDKQSIKELKEEISILLNRPATDYQRRNRAGEILREIFGSDLCEDKGCGKKIKFHKGLTCFCGVCGLCDACKGDGE
ncbi:hypothetical protein BMS3Abin17_01231 [archaeon BMS3Abin17]|nr:hypothetical protein BMS3Abin17_01231 [archaeon BMS3Abin17]HDZ60435.1 hypothetical protein [Candidatus Pacearchaeota archaeon]